VVLGITARNILKLELTNQRRDFQEKKKVQNTHSKRDQMPIKQPLLEIQ